MKIFIAELCTETNTFSPMPTGWRGFEESGIGYGTGSQRRATVYGGVLARWRARSEALGWTVVESVSACAQPAGRTLRPVYEALRDRILDDLAAAAPVDLVLLGLHGAMVAEGYDDCEGDLLARIRALVGPGAVVGAELDLHCHLTAAMRDNATALIGFKEYPHTDMVERADELFDLCRAAAEGRVRPVTAVFDCAMMGLYQTTREPMAGFVAAMRAAEAKPGILSVSLGHGFPWADVADVGTKLWVIADCDADLARREAERLGRQVYGLRERLAVPALPISAALDRLEAGRDGLVVLADIADNPGGGAPGDSTFLLEGLLARGIGGVALGCLWDPVAVDVCLDAGPGAVLPLRVGGKMGPVSGRPLDLEVTVRAVRQDHCQTGLTRAPVQLGRSAWVHAAGIDLVLCSIRTQVFAPDAFTGLGIDLGGLRAVAVKSTQHFHAAFAPLASVVLYVDSPGAIAPDFAAIPYTKRPGAYWPRVPDPLGLG